MQHPVPALLRRVALLGAGLLVAAAGPAAAVIPSGGEPVPGRLIVEMTEEGARLLRAGKLEMPHPAGGSRPLAVEPLFTTRTGRLGRIFVLTVPSGAGSPDNAAWTEILRSADAVVDAESDRVTALSALPDDPYLTGAPLDPIANARQYHLLNPDGLSLNATRAWPFVPSDREVVVAIVDSGVLWRHPDLGGADPPTTGVIWRNEAEYAGLPGVDDDLNGKVDDVVGWDFVNLAVDLPTENRDAREDAAVPDNDPSDFAGHGTQVAGLVTALTDNGVGISGQGGARIRLMPVRVGWARTTGLSVVYMSYCAQGIEYAALMGADVANCSWDSVNGFGLGAALDFAINEHDMVIVGSAGNGSTSSTGSEYLASRADCVGVAGILQNGTKASSSNYGSWVDIAGFFSGMVTTGFDHNAGLAIYEVNSSGGTSFSSPMVAAEAALLRAVDPSSPASAVRDVIRLTGRPLDDVEPTYAAQLGGGLADMAAAVRAAGGGWERQFAVGGLAPRTTGWVASSPGALVAGNGDDDGFAFLDETVSAAARVPVVVVPRPGLPDAILFDDGARLRGVDAGGSALAGFPVLPPGGLRRVAAADLDGDNAVEILLAGADTVTAIGLDGAPRWSAAVGLLGLAVGDFDGDRPGLEWGGPDAAGDLRVFGADGLPLAWDGASIGAAAVDPAAVEFDGTGRAALVAATSNAGTPGVTAWADGAALAGFPRTWNGGPVTALSATGSAREERVDVVAVDASGAVRLIPGPGSPTEIRRVDAGGAVAGAVLAADVDGDFECDLVALRADGMLFAWRRDLSPVSGFPRRFPFGATEPPAVIDGVARRYIAVNDADGVLWAIPAGLADAPAPWRTAGATAARTGWVRYLEATPVEVVVRLAWEPDARRLCWRGVGEAVVALRLRDGDGRALWEGAGLGEGCAPVPGATGGDLLVLEGIERQGAWRELARVVLPPARLRLGPAVPNPASDAVRFALEAPTAAVTAVVFDAAGRRVRALDVPAGSRELVWDGRDDAGRAAAAGLYLVRARSGGATATARVLRLTGQ